MQIQNKPRDGTSIRDRRLRRPHRRLPSGHFPHKPPQLPLRDHQPSKESQQPTEQQLMKTHPANSSCHCPAVLIVAEQSCSSRPSTRPPSQLTRNIPLSPPLRIGRASC